MPGSHPEYSRRTVLKVGLFGLVGLPFLTQETAGEAKSTVTNFDQIEHRSKKADLFTCRGGTPVQNMRHLVSMLGGIESIVGKNDIVVIKVNSQWWVQGMTNTDSLIALIDIILTSNSFKGEIIIADNHQFQDDNSRGWITETPNGLLNLNQVIEHLKIAGYLNVNKYHWHDGGANDSPMQGDAHGQAVVGGPDEGDGYVWESDNYYETEGGQKCLMTYPIFTSPYSGVTIDLKNGAFQNGSYTGQPVTFINMSSLNHHSPYCGVTATVKNLMGVVDMSCGYPAPAPEETFNTHYIGLRSKSLERLRRLGNLLHWRLRRLVAKIVTEDDMIDFHYTGGALGHWIRTVRKPDLNIITAEWVGYGSRTDTSLSARPKALVASTDAVAADYYAAKHILLPETIKAAPESKFVALNDPDNTDGTFSQFLKYAARETGGAIQDSEINTISEMTQ